MSKNYFSALNYQDSDDSDSDNEPVIVQSCVKSTPIIKPTTTIVKKGRFAALKKKTYKVKVSTDSYYKPYKPRQSSKFDTYNTKIEEPVVNTTNKKPTLVLGFKTKTKAGIDLYKKPQSQRSYFLSKNTTKKYSEKKSSFPTIKSKTPRELFGKNITESSNSLISGYMKAVKTVKYVPKTNGIFSPDGTATVNKKTRKILHSRKKLMLKMKKQQKKLKMMSEEEQKKQEELFLYELSNDYASDDEGHQEALMNYYKSRDCPSDDEEEDDYDESSTSEEEYY